MRRYTLLSTLCALLALILIPASSQAVWNFLDPFPKPDGYAEFEMKQGLWDNIPVWFILLETNNIRFSQAYEKESGMREDFVDNFNGYSLVNGPTWFCGGVTLDYKLSSFQDTDVVNNVYIVTNGRYCKQPWIFTTVPNESGTNYSGLWKVAYLRWVDPTEAVPIRSFDEVDMLLADGDIQVSNVIGGTAPDYGVPYTIIDAPIVAVGRLGGPWWPAPSNNGFNYRLKQVKAYYDYPKTKLICLPTYFVFASEYISNRTVVARIVVPDIWDPDPTITGNPAPPGTLPDRFGANWAPGLGSADLPLSDTQIFYEFFPGIGNAPERPPFQFPVVEEIPGADCWPYGDFDPFCWRNLNTEYSAIMIHTVLNKVLDPDDPFLNEAFLKATFADVDLIEDLIALDKLLSDESGVILNAPVVPPILQRPQPEPEIPILPG